MRSIIRSIQWRLNRGPCWHHMRNFVYVVFSYSAWYECEKCGRRMEMY